MLKIRLLGFYSRLYRLLIRFSILLFITLNSTGTFAKNNSCDYEMLAIESVRKSICVNGLWSSACSSDSDDILKCDRQYTGQQAQRICQYEKGLETRRLAWALSEIKKQAEAEAKQERLRQNAAAEAEIKRKTVEAQAREVRAQNCLISEFPWVSNVLKQIRNDAKSRVGTSLDVQRDELGHKLFFTYTDINSPTALFIPEKIRQTLNWKSIEFMVETTCDSATEYFGYVVSVDGLKIDGFLAYKKIPNSTDEGGVWTEINSLEWLGPRIQKEVKRLAAVKAESEKLNLEKLKAEEDRVVTEKAKAKAQFEYYKSFLMWVILVSSLVGLFAFYFWRRWSRKKTLAEIDKKLSSPIENKYSFTPTTNDQISMQNAFRSKYPFVQHNVRFEHMARFIEGCIKHEAENGCFPSKREQHQILLNLDSSRV